MQTLPRCTNESEEEGSMKTTSTSPSSDALGDSQEDVMKQQQEAGSSPTEQRAFPKAESDANIEEFSQSIVFDSTATTTPIHHMSKSDAIRKTLREKEKKLSALVRESGRSWSNISSNEQQEIPVTSAGENVADRSRLMVFEGKDQLDRMEALKVLSQTAVTLQRKLEKEKLKAHELRKQLSGTECALQLKENETLALQSKTKMLKDSNETNEEIILKLQEQLEECDGALRNIQAESFHFEQSAASNWSSRIGNDANSLTEQFEHLEFDLLSRNAEIDDLKQQLNEKIKRIVELEVDLETHSQRYNESLIQFAKNEEAISFEDDDVCATLMDIPFGLEPPVTPKRSTSKWGINRVLRNLKRREKCPSFQESIGCDDRVTKTNQSQYQRDIASLDARYKRDRYLAKIEVDKFKQENNEYLIRILSLEKTMQDNYQKNCDHAQQEAISTASPQTALISRSHTRHLEEKVASLENQRALQSRVIQNLKMEMNKLEVNNKKQMELNRELAQSLQLDNDVKMLHLAMLQRALQETTKKSSNTSNHTLACLQTSVISGLEAKLKESVTDRLRLNRDLEVKTMTIAGLREEIVRLRLENENGRRNAAYIESMVQSGVYHSI